MAQFGSRGGLTETARLLERLPFPLPPARRLDTATRGYGHYGTDMAGCWYFLRAPTVIIHLLLFTCHMQPASYQHQGFDLIVNCISKSQDSIMVDVSRPLLGYMGHCSQ